MVFTKITATYVGILDPKIGLTIAKHYQNYYSARAIKTHDFIDDESTTVLEIVFEGFVAYHSKEIDFLKKQGWSKIRVESRDDEYKLTDVRPK